MFVALVFVGCVQAAKPSADDNGWCYEAGGEALTYDESPLKLRVTAGFYYEGGTCSCDCPKLPLLSCPVLDHAVTSETAFNQSELTGRIDRRKRRQL